MWSMNCGPQPALVGSLVLLPNYLSICNALQLLRYNTTLNAFGKSEFHLVCYSYSITRAQKAKLNVCKECSYAVVAGRGGRGVCPDASRGGAERAVR